MTRSARLAAVAFAAVVLSPVGAASAASTITAHPEANPYVDAEVLASPLVGEVVVRQKGKCTQVEVRRYVQGTWSTKRVGPCARVTSVTHTVDNAGRAFVLYNVFDVTDKKKSGIWMSKSSNRGRTWSSPKRLVTFSKALDGRAPLFKAAIRYGRIYLLYAPSSFGIQRDSDLRLHAFETSGRPVGTRLAATRGNFKVNTGDKGNLVMHQTRSRGLVMLWARTDSGGQRAWYATTRITDRGKGRSVNVKYGRIPGVVPKPETTPTFFFGGDRNLYRVYRTVSLTGGIQQYTVGRWNGKRFSDRTWIGGIAYDIVGPAFIAAGADRSGRVSVAVRQPAASGDERDCVTNTANRCYRSLPGALAQPGIVVFSGSFAAKAIPSQVSIPWVFGPTAVQGGSTVIEWYPGHYANHGFLYTGDQTRLSYDESYEVIDASGSSSGVRHAGIVSDPIR